jgi:hypothetical protein
MSQQGNLGKNSRLLDRTKDRKRATACAPGTLLITPQCISFQPWKKGHYRALGELLTHVFMFVALLFIISGLYSLSVAFLLG